MRFSASFPKFLSFLAGPVLAVMLALPANAEPTPEETPVPSSPEISAPANSSDTTSEVSPSGEATTEAEPQAEPDAASSGEADEASEQTDAAENTPDATPEKPKSSVIVNIDKSSQEMTVFVDGVELYTWPVSTGLSNYFTPSGTYTASSMNKIWYSKQWDNAPMPHSIFFTKRGHAIHGTNEVKRLGKPASHGCVRLSPENARTLYGLVEANGLAQTQVILTGLTPGGERPQVASPKGPPEGYWLPPGYREKPRKRRRGLFGRRWFEPQDRRGYYAPRGRYYYPPRGVGPRGY